MELLDLLELLFFFGFFILFFSIFLWITHIIDICERVDMLFYAYLYCSFWVLIWCIDLILEVSGIWESVSVYVLQQLS